MIEIKHKRLFVDEKEYKMFSAEVEYFRLEQKYWLKILKLLQDTGIQIVNTYVPWRICSPVRGKYDFKGDAGRLDICKFLEICEKLNLKVFLRPGPLIVSEMECGGLPNWLTSDPNICVWNAENKIPDGFGAYPNQKKGANPSYLHPLYLEYVREWLTKVDDVVKDYFHSKGGPVIFIQLDNEVSMVCKDSMLGSDYNPIIVKKAGLYHEWLRKKYKSIKDLSYRKKYFSFEDIPAPRELDKENPDLIYYFDWIAFKEWMMSEYIRRLRNIHEKNNIGEVVFYTNLNAHRPETVPNNWKLYEDATNGTCGYDFYREPWLDFDGYYRMVKVIKLSDAIMKIPWSAEFMGGSWGKDKDAISTQIPAETTEFMSLLSIAHGLKGISYYMFHDREYWFNAVVSEMGHKRYVYNVISKVMKFVNEVEDFNGLSRISEVGCLFYRPYAWITHLEDPMPGDETKVHIGEIKIDNIQNGRSYIEFEGLIRLLCQAGYEPSIVDPWIFPEQMKKYKVILLSAQSFMDEDTQKLLLDYVKSGGILIVDPYLPYKNLNQMNTDIFKNIVKKDKMLKVDKIELRAFDKGFIGYEIVNDRDNVIIERRFGKGKIIIIGTYIGQVKAGEDPECNVEFINTILRKYGNLVPCIEKNNRFIDIIIQENENEKILFVVNMNSRPKEVILNCNDKSIKGIKEFYSSEEFKVKNRKIIFTIDSKNVLIFRILY